MTITIKYTDAQSPWSQPPAVPLVVYEYVDQDRWYIEQKKRTRLRNGDLWVQVPNGRYVRIVTKGKLGSAGLFSTEHEPTTLKSATTNVPHTYNEPVVGSFQRTAGTVLLDGQRITEPLVVLPGDIYLRYDNTLGYLIDEYYYSYGLRTEVVYSPAPFDEYQCGQMIRISFYNRGLALVKPDLFTRCRKKEFCERLLHYYILHKLRTT